jgi:hypothetical protein
MSGIWRLAVGTEILSMVFRSLLQRWSAVSPLSDHTASYFRKLYFSWGTCWMVEKLCYKPDGRAFDSLWGHWTFQLTTCFHLHYGHGVDWASCRNKYQELSCGYLKGHRRSRRLTLTPSVSQLYRKCGSSEASQPYGAPRSSLGLSNAARVKNVWFYTPIYLSESIDIATMLLLIWNVCGSCAKGHIIVCTLIL